LPPSLISPFVFDDAGDETGLRIGAVERQVRCTYDRRFFNETMLATVRINKNTLH